MISSPTTDHLIVDECPHLSAVSFELVARRAKARYVLGLSATIARKDGHHPIIFMQCDPVRYRVNATTCRGTRLGSNSASHGPGASTSSAL
jgi:superfamily II DNA or RNA helicase